jgi:hypothetical protein
MTAAISLFVFGAITAALSLQLSLGTLRAPGSGLFPLVLGLMLMGLAAGQVVQLRLSQPKLPAEPAAAEPVGDDSTRRVLLFIGAVAVATALLEPLGYLLVSLLLMLALLQVLAFRRWGLSGWISLLTAGACYMVFVRWLKIPLPSGWFGF